MTLRTFTTSLFLSLTMLSTLIMTSCSEPNENRLITSQKEVTLSNQKPVVEIKIMSKGPWEIKARQGNEVVKPNPKSNDGAFIKLGHWLAISPISGQPGKEGGDTRNFTIRVEASRTGFTDRAYEEQFYIVSGQRTDTIRIKVLPRVNRPAIKDAPTDHR